MSIDDQRVDDKLMKACRNRQSGLTAANNGITYAPFHDADIPDDVAAKLEETRQGLASGEITTGLDPATGEPL